MSNNYNIINSIDKTQCEIMIIENEVQSIDIEINSYYKIIKNLENKRQLLQMKRDLYQKDLENTLQLLNDRDKNK